MYLLGLQEAFSLVIGFIEVMCRVFNLALVVSNIIGYFIVSCGLSVWTTLASVCETAYFIVKVLYEDGLIFLIDVGDKVSVLSNVIVASLHLFCKGLFKSWLYVKNVYLSVLDLLTSTYNLVTTHGSRILGIVCSIPETLKQTLILLGNGVWLALQIIPLAFVYVSSMTVFLVGRSFEELKSITQQSFDLVLNSSIKIVKFFTDIPTNSIIGMLVGTAVLYFSIKHRQPLVYFTIYVITWIQSHFEHILNSMWRGLENTVLNLVANQNNSNRHIDMAINENQVDEGSESETDSSVVSDIAMAAIGPVKCQTPWTNSKRLLRLQLVEEQENKLCVVCQDRGKNVILFPCRHVCLCTDCSDVIKARQGTCPICRERVRRTMKVYL